MNIYDVIKRPLVTEKTTMEKDAKNIISFAVSCDANKIEIKDAVEKFFKVEVMNVNTINIAGKKKRVGKYVGKRSDWKKAYVTLKEGNKVDFFEV